MQEPGFILNSSGLVGHHDFYLVVKSKYIWNTTFINHDHLSDLMVWNTIISVMMLVITFARGFHVLCLLVRSLWASKSRHPKQVSAVCHVKHVLMSHCWKYWSVDSRKEKASKEEFLRWEKWSSSLRWVNEMWVREEWWTWALFVVWVFCARARLLPLFSLVSAEGINFIYNSREIPHHDSTQSPGSEDCGITMLGIKQINWTLLRSGRAGKCEKLHLPHLT